MIINGFSKAKDLILNARNILLAAHEEPDADGLGSLLAFQIILNNLGKTVQSFCSSPIPHYLRFLPDWRQIKNTIDCQKIDLVIGLDYGNLARLKINEDILQNIPLITFDHHLPDNQQGLLIVNSNASSTAEIIFHFLDFLGAAIDKFTASCLLAGVYEDTGGFRHANTSKTALKIASQLMEAGAPLGKIAKHIAQPSPSNIFQSWAVGFDQIILEEESGFAYSIIPYQNLIKFPGETENFSGFINLVCAAPEVKLALLLLEKKLNCWSGNLRTQKDRGINVARIARTLGGGGHKLAAGFQTNAQPKEIIEKIRILLNAEKK